VIRLNDEEKGILWDALAIAKAYYGERGQREKEEKVWDMLGVLSLTERVTFELYKDRITEEGIKEVQKFLKKREETKREQPNNVIQFPQGANT